MSRNQKSHDTLLRQLCMLRAIPRHPRVIGTGDLVTILRGAQFVTINNDKDFRSVQRTVQRDLISLSSVLPLRGDEKKPQGWSWQPDTPLLDLPHLDAQTALVFHLADRYLRSLLPASTLGYLSPWFKAATEVLDHQGNGLSGWRGKIRILAPGMSLLAPKSYPVVQAAVTQALLLERQLRISYRPAGKARVKEYDFHPLGLVVRQQQTYLVGPAFDYNNPLLLLLHRIDAATVLDAPARKLAGFDLDRYIEAGEFGWPRDSGTKISLVCSFSGYAATLVRERPLSKDQRLEEGENGECRLVAVVPDTYDLRVWLQSLGNQVVVHEPTSLRNEIRQALKETLRRYGV